eukprot:jgi/Botrbrau1/14903/Bobra.0018s0008.1
MSFARSFALVSHFAEGQTGFGHSPGSKPAVVSMYPRMIADSHGQDYYYSLLLQYVPHRDESQLVCDGTIMAAFHEYKRAERICTDDHFTTIDLKTLGRQYLDLEGEGEHDEGAENQEAEPDPEYDAIRAADNLNATYPGISTTGWQSATHIPHPTHLVCSPSVHLLLKLPKHRRPE